jgi:Glycosidases
LLIIGAYPKSFIDHTSSSDIRALGEFLDSTMNPSVGVHILPFWMSEGDGGFSLSSWHEMDPKYGTLDDIKLITKQRRVIVDGIYNHVGWHHPIIAKLLQDPGSNSCLIHKLDDKSPPARPLAPRGGSVYRTHSFGDYTWQVWQTFGAELVDVNLSNNEILYQVYDNLKLIASMGVYGVRFDALPYYGKNSNLSPLHNSDGIDAAYLIIQKAHELGLDPILQIDCDDTLKHYQKLEEFTPTVIDFSFDTYLINALLTEDVSDLKKHLEATQSYPEVRIQRPIRTHDGVLFRSGNQSESFVEKVVGMLRNRNYYLRFTNGTPYECNNSLPFLLGALESSNLYYKKLVLSIVVGILTSDSTYIYLNSLLGDTPEITREFSVDPRELQRHPISLPLLPNIGWGSEISKEALSQINKLADLSQDAEIRGVTRTVYNISACNGTLIITNSSLGLGAFLNFTSKYTNFFTEYKSILSSGCGGGTIQPYGFNLFEIN